MKISKYFLEGVRISIYNLEDREATIYYGILLRRSTTVNHWKPLCGKLVLKGSLYRNTDLNDIQKLKALCVLDQLATKPLPSRVTQQFRKFLYRLTPAKHGPNTF